MQPQIIFFLTRSLGLDAGCNVRVAQLALTSATQSQFQGCYFGRLSARRHYNPVKTESLWNCALPGARVTFRAQLNRMPSPPKKSKKDPVAPPREPARAIRTVGIVGAGRLGTVLGRALTRAGYEVKVAVARRSA